MEPSVVVAGTFVASVLEHLGYLYQARFLNDFQSFFRDAGALIYLIAAVGGVIAVAMYGSTRAAQYFLIGPALFWFLVGPTTQTEGVRWKIGGGQFLGMFREQGRQSSDDFTQSVLRKMNEVESSIAQADPQTEEELEAAQQNAGGEIDVAIGFYIFAKTISDTVNTMVDVILHREDTEDLMAQSKVQGLELISNILPYSHDHIQQIEEFSTQCSEYFSAASSAAELRARQRGLESARGNGNVIEDVTITDSYQTYRQRAIRHGRRNYQKLDPVHSGFGQLIRDLLDAPQTVEGTEGLIQFANQLETRLEGGDELRCEEAWRLLAGYTWIKAKAELPRLLGVGSGFRRYEEARRFTCAELTRKATDDETAECSLEPVISMYLLYNHWRKQDTFQRLVTRHNNGRDLLNPKADTIVTGLRNEGFEAVLIKDKDGNEHPLREQFFSDRGQPFLAQKFINKSDLDNPEFDDDKARTTWVPVTTISELRGADHAMNVGSRRFDTARLKQQLFSYAMQLPYYQGVALFFIAVAYPFLALIVLLPGKAHHFLSVPLAWAWVKSWDVGFASIIVLDKVMYNLLPNWNLSPSLRAGPWTTTDQLIEVLSQGFFYDPWASIHHYYAIMAMATLGIPAVTGAIFLGSKRAVLASFTQAPAAQAKDRADRAAAGFSVQAQSERNHMMMQVKGLSLLMSLHGGTGNIAQGARGVSASTYAAANAVIDALGKQDLQKLIKGDLSVIANAPEDVAKAFAGFIEDYKQHAGDYANFASKLHARWDKNIGRAGFAQQLEEAYAGALENKNASYELSGAGDSPYMELTSLALSVDRARINLRGKLYRTIGKTAGAYGSDPLAGGVALTALGVIGKEGLDKKGIGLTELKNLAGGEALTNEEYLQSSFFKNRFIYSDPSLKRHVDALEDHFDDPLLGKLYRDIHEVLSADGPQFGGPSTHTQLLLNSTALQRRLETVGGGVQPVEESIITVDRASLNAGIDNLGQRFSGYLGGEIKADYSAVEVELAQGYRMYVATIAEYENDLNRRLAQYPFIKGAQPNEY